ncbi:MAG: ORF6N domain-containing protein [Elusimicrobiaceae bacterium]|nr:ORF6N domain-containing protein [Elusimicrobiaceae bacterium]
MPTKVLNQAAKCNKERFFSDFMFQLTKEEKQAVITNCNNLTFLKFSSALP